jgi:hypothetical protein
MLSWTRCQMYNTSCKLKFSPRFYASKTHTYLLCGADPFNRVHSRPCYMRSTLLAFSSCDDPSFFINLRWDWCRPFFSSTYSIQFATARHRLQIGMPATVEHRVVRLDEQPSAVSVAECVHNYIGLIDTLKLNMWETIIPYWKLHFQLLKLCFCFCWLFPTGKPAPTPPACCLALYFPLDWLRLATFTWPLKLAAKDQVAPYLSDLLTSLYRVQQLPTDFAGTILVRHWIVRLDKMRASDELGDDEIRQLLYDTENSYNAFMRLLGGHEEHTRQGQSQVE